MEGDSSVTSTNLPKDLVERILAMVPFPFVFKSRVLSKAWLARFSPITSLEVEEKKRLAISFQKEVGEWSTSWNTFCPVYLGKVDFIAYDRGSDRWLRMPRLSFLPENALTFPRIRSRGRTCFFEGALLFLYAGKDQLCVANVLTRSWKQLPPPPHTDSYWFDGRILSHNSSQTYKLFLFYSQVDPFVQIYDSTSGAWSIKRLDESIHKPPQFYFYASIAYLNGVFYRLVCRHDERALGLLAFNVTEGAFKELRMPPSDVVIGRCATDLVVCNDNLFVTLTCYKSVEIVILMKVDLESQIWVQWTQGPPAALDFGEFKSNAASDGDCIFWLGKSESAVLAYDIHTEEWSIFPVPASVTPCPRPKRTDWSNLEEDEHLENSWPKSDYEWTASTFEPGLNPFVAV